MVVPIREDIDNKVGDNVVNFKPKEEVKLRKDGKPKQTPCNSKNRKGLSQEVFPVKDEEMVKKIEQYFRDKIDNEHYYNKKKIAARNLLMWILGINVGLRISDLRKLTWNQIFYKDGTMQKGVTIIEKKTKKPKTFFFNPYAIDAINEYVEMFNPNIKGTGYVFKSREAPDGEVKPIGERTMGKIVKNACKECGFQKNANSHTLRKTFGYHWFQAHQNNVKALTILQRLFNHESSQITLAYIGIEDEESEEYYNDLTW